MPASRSGPTLVGVPPPSDVYCPRCRAPARLVRPWRGWRVARIGWFAVVFVMLGVSPIMMSDYAVMIPTMMVILAAYGPLHGLASVRPTCRRCGLAFEPAELRRAESRLREPRVTRASIER